MENNDNIEELIAGYALGILDENEQAQAQKLVKTDPNARALLDDFTTVTNGLALSVAPVDLPAGSLGRLRAKANVTSVSNHTPPSLPATHVVMPAPIQFKPRAARRTGLNVGLGWAAAVVLFITTAIFGALWLGSNQSLSDTQRNQRDLTALLSAPGLKVSDLKPTGNPTGTLRLYADPTTNKAYLVAQNLTTLPSDKEYEAWLITSDNRADKAGLLGTGADGSAVYALAPGQPVDQYKEVAITVEKKGGVDKSQQQPILLGSL